MSSPEWKARVRDLVQKVDQLYAAESETGRKVLDLHSCDREYGWCMGCDWGGVSGEPADWPCRTVLLIAESNGATLDADSGRLYRYRSEVGA